MSTYWELKVLFTILTYKDLNYAVESFILYCVLTLGKQPYEWLLAYRANKRWNRIRMLWAYIQTA